MLDETQKSWKGKAIEYCEKFLDLWKDTDSGIAEVEEGKKRVAGLRSQQLFSPHCFTLGLPPNRIPSFYMLY
jgi:hypothetical protein